MVRRARAVRMTSPPNKVFRRVEFPQTYRFRYPHLDERG